jgi:pyruvate kinase
LDYPQGRTKPPKPMLKLSDAMDALITFRNIKYFAISNVEDPDKIGRLSQCVPDRIIIVPKIESRKGVKNIYQICVRANTKVIMLDKEDLYSEVLHNSAVYNKYVDMARDICKRAGIDLLELQGVIFSER